MNEKYVEVQKADSIWTLGILALTCIFNWYIYFVGHYDNLQFFYSSMISVSLICLILSILSLRIFIDKDGVHYKLFPFHWEYRLIKMNDIARYEIVTYRPLKDYGGWGIRYSGKGKAYTIRGNKGLLIHLKDHNKPVLIGTCMPDRLATMLHDNKFPV